METLRPLQTAAAQSLRHVSRRRVYTPLYQCLHTSAPKKATPVPHPTTPGPPPEPPVPKLSEAHERVARKKKQMEMLQKGRELKASASNPSLTLKKRFWQEVSVKETPDGLQIFLDQRPVRTPDKEILTLPHTKHHLATGIALEWDLLVSAQQALKQYNIPLTSLAARALDIRNADAQGQSATRDSIIKMLMNYLDTDTLLCWAPEKTIHDELRDAKGRTLRETQIELAKPILAYLTTKVWPGVEIVPILGEESILPTPQPEGTKQVIRGWLTGLPAFELAGLERAVLGSKSLLVGVRLLAEWSQEFAHLRDSGSGKRFGVEEAAEAASAEVRWQTDMWGEVEDTHDVEKEDLKRQLGSVILLVSGC